MEMIVEWLDKIEFRRAQKETEKKKQSGRYIL